MTGTKAMLLIGVVACAAIWPRAGAFALDIDTIAEGLEYPWCIAFLPDGDMLVTERAGRLRLISGGKLEAKPVTGTPEVYVRAQGGLFDVLPHPDFSRNRIVYLSYAHGAADANTTRVARAVFDGNSLRDVEAIFDTVPAKRTPVHYGGRMAFMPDGTLLVTTGDGFDYREQAQQLDSLLGKLVRLNADGSIPADNPFVNVAGARPEIWSYGHRNPQGLAVDSASHSVYLHEHGPRGGDELNRIEPGLNYGWPVIGYGVDYSGAKISPYTEWPGMEQPLVYWVPSIAPAGMTLYTGTLFPDWHGDLFVASLVEKSVRRIVLENARVTRQEILLTDLDTRIRDVRSGPDGRLYLLTDSDSGAVLAVSP